jgi:hypothetical protein
MRGGAMSGAHALFTGANRGVVTLEDGTEVDVSPDWLFFDTPEEVAAVAAAIEKTHN